jgi:trehalose utilization protein
VQQRVLKGMGLLVLHSGHHSKLFRRLMGTNANLSWRETPDGDLERVWVVNPSHPIAEGLPPYFEVNASEMYGEPFDIPQPDELVFISWYSGGEVFRSGCTFQRGRGRIFFFSPGHETYPIYHDKTVHKVISNGIRWARQKHTDGRILENWHRAEPLHGRPDKVKA